MTLRRPRRTIATAILVVSLGALLTAPIRGAVLSRVGALLILDDPLEPTELLALTREAGDTGVLEVADLYAAGHAERVLLLQPQPSAVDQELARRGVQMSDLTLDRLLQLGVPRADLSVIDAGEGGTTADTQALAVSAHRQRSHSVTVVVSPTHGRRYKRALLRAWPEDLPPPRVRTSRHHPFRADTWWRLRGTLRTGLVKCRSWAWTMWLTPGEATGRCLKTRTEESSVHILVNCGPGWTCQKES